MEYALVTGGSRGIGKAICLRLAAMGYNIIINYTSNDEEALKTQALIKEKGVDAQLMKFDVSVTADADTHIETWIKEHTEDTISVLVNNAGIRKDNLLVFISPEDWHRVLNITVDGFYNVTRHVVKSMLSKRKGRIVNIVSLSGLKGMPGQTNYSASKGAIIAATKALAQEVGKRGITVNAVAPGYIATDNTAALQADATRNAAILSRIPAARWGTPDDFKGVTVFLASQASNYMSGEIVTVDGGWMGR